MEFIDKTGSIPSDADFESAERAVAQLLTRHIMQLPTDVAVELGNIHRCISVGRAAARLMRESE